MIPSPGVYPNVPAEEYRAWDAINIGLLVEASASMLRLRTVRESPKESTSAMDVGSLFHTVLLEPAKIDLLMSGPIHEAGKYKGEEFGRDTQAWAEHAEANPGRILCTESERTRMAAVLEAFRSNEYARGAVFDPARQTEVSLVWNDELTGLACKCRIDVLLPEFQADLKTTEDGRLSAFWLRNYAMRFHWFYRHCWYERGHRLATGSERKNWFVMAQSVPPYEIVVCRPNDRCLLAAAKQIDGWMIQYAESLRTGVWPGIAPKPIELSGPAWFEGLVSPSGIDVEGW